MSDTSKEQLFAVEKVLAIKKHNTHGYVVQLKWKGYSENPLWWPISNLFENLCAFEEDLEKIKPGTYNLVAEFKVQTEVEQQRDACATCSWNKTGTLIPLYTTKLIVAPPPDVTALFCKFRESPNINKCLLFCMFGARLECKQFKPNEAIPLTCKSPWGCYGA